MGVSTGMATLELDIYVFQWVKECPFCVRLDRRLINRGNRLRFAQRRRCRPCPVQQSHSDI